MKYIHLQLAAIAVLCVAVASQTYALESVTTGSQATQATVGAINSKVDTSIAALQTKIDGIIYCNNIRKFYAPGDPKADVKDCVGVQDYDFTMAGSNNITANGVVSATGVTYALIGKVTGNGYAVRGDASTNPGGLGGDFYGGAYGIRSTGPTYGVYASSAGVAVYGTSTGGWGVQGVATHYGVYGSGDTYAGYFNGPTYANAFYYTSDQRLKDDIKPLTGALDKLKGIEGKTFTWNKNKENGAKAGKTDIGVIAQDVEKVLPQAVTTNKATGYKAVDYPRLVPLLVNAIKEQQAEIDALKQQVDALKK